MKFNVLKKNGLLEEYDFNKIKTAVTKSAVRVNVKFNQKDWEQLEFNLLKLIGDVDNISVEEMHRAVENTLEVVSPKVAKSYKDYRNYKKDYAIMMEKVLANADELNFKVDKSNANTTAALISTKRSLIYTGLNKERYKTFELSKDQLKAIDEGYIYIHDLGARSDTYNCCLFDMGKVLQGGFEWENIGYNEPKDIRTACNLISDITLNCAAQQYGGFTIPEIDSILAPYARKTYKKYKQEYMDIVLSNKPSEMTDMERLYLNNKSHQYAIDKLEKDISQGFQGFEHTFNTVASSRGDFPFVTMSGGCEEDIFGQLVWKTALKVRREGQGHPGNKRPAIFPKLVFLYTEKLHGEGKPLYDVYKEGVITSAKAMYPDWLSLDIPDPSDIQGVYVMDIKSSLAETFHKYHKFGVSRWLLDENNNVQENNEWVDAIVSPMGCRAYLSPLFQSGGFKPINENDKPIFHQRFNGGAVSLNLPMIYRQAQLETNKNEDPSNRFFTLLKHYCDMINEIHINTYEFLSKLKASCNPVAFCEGGFGNLNPNDEIRPLVNRITFSYGFTALNELQRLATKQSLYEVRDDFNSIALKTEKFIVDYVEQKKKERSEGKIPYIAAIYATPAESLCGTQVNQFKNKYGIIKNVSDKAYFTNSFHMWVGEDITPFEKQDAEYNYFHLSSGGHIQYCRFPNGDNLTVLDKTIKRAMKLGYYFGVNIESSYCGDCGCKVDDAVEECPCCRSKNITTINRVCGYLGYSKVSGDTKMNEAKMAEIKDRKSM